MHARLLSVPLTHVDVDKRRHHSLLKARAGVLFGAYAAHSLGNLEESDVRPKPNPHHGAVAQQTFVHWAGIWLHLANGKSGAPTDAQAVVVQRLEQALGRSLSADDALREVPALLLASPEYVGGWSWRNSSRSDGCVGTHEHASVRRVGQHEARSGLNRTLRAEVGLAFSCCAHSHTLIVAAQVEMLRAFMAAGGLRKLLADLMICASDGPSPCRRKRKRPSSRGTGGGRAKVPNLHSASTSPALSLKSARSSPFFKAESRDKGDEAIQSSSSESETEAEVTHSFSTCIRAANNFAACTARTSDSFCSAPVS